MNASMRTRVNKAKANQSKWKGVPRLRENLIERYLFTGFILLNAGLRIFNRGSTERR